MTQQNFGPGAPVADHPLGIDDDHPRSLIGGSRRDRAGIHIPNQHTDERPRQTRGQAGCRWCRGGDSNPCDHVRDSPVCIQIAARNRPNPPRFAIA